MQMREVLVCTVALVALLQDQRKQLLALVALSVWVGHWRLNSARGCTEGGREAVCR